MDGLLKGTTLETTQGRNLGGLAPAIAREDSRHDRGPEGPDGLLSEAQLRTFREQGFLALDQLASPADVAYIREVIERLFQIKAGHKEGAHFNFAGPDDDPNAPSFPQIIAPYNYEDGLKKTALYAQAAAIARQILGPEVRFGGDHTLNKPALNGPATPWHQDESFRDPKYDYEEISIWVPLQPVGETNGCMQFIAGTHRAELLPHRSPNNDTKAHALECYEGFDPKDAISCPLPAGGCTLHTGRTLHATGPNRSPEPRLAYVLNFAIPPVPASRQRSFPWLEEKETARLERKRTWMRRGGMFVEAWRLIKRTEPKDYGKLAARLVRKASLMKELLKGKPAGR